MADLRELIEMLEKATGPKLDLDGRVWCAVNGYEFVMWDGAGCVYKNPAAPTWDIGGIKHASAREVRPYTASLDAAVALVERMLPGWACGFDSGPKTHIAFVDPHDFADRIFGASFTAEAATPALALLIALLRAIEER